MSWRATGWMLAKLALGLSLVFAVPGVMAGQVATTTVTETVYHADGTPASGSVIVSWPSFTAANGASVPAGSTTATIAANGLLSLGLVPNAGSTPIGSYYTAIYHLDDGSVTREYWVVPVSAYAVQVSTIKSAVLPLSVAQQTVSKAYVDTAIATAMAGTPLSSSTPYVLKAGDTMTGPLELPGDPTAPLQASDKQYVDEQTAGLTAGLGQKVSTLPSATQTVAQPAGTQLAVNILNGVEYASQYVSGAGNNGIANAAASPDCASGCEVKAEQTYAGTENVAPTSWNNGTHVTDDRGGAVLVFFNAQTIESDGLTGGSNLFPRAIQGSVPYFKTTYNGLGVTGNYNTPGQHILFGLNQNCYGIGDCLLGGWGITSSGGFRDDSDEGAHPFDLLMREDPNVFEGTCATGCTSGSTSLQLSVTANGGTQGEGRYLIDTNPAKTITGGTIVAGTNTGAGARQPQASFTGTSFPLSTFLETAQTIPTQATILSPGTVSVAIATGGVPSGFQTSTTALPTAAGVACVTDATNSNLPLNYEMAAYTTIDGSHLRMTLNKAHASGATIAVGGLCGYGIEQTVDTSAGIRQVFPVVGSTSPTTLLYAGGLSSIVGVQQNTSAYLNVNAAIASITRSGGTVTVTTAGNLPVDVNGLTLTIAGVTDSSYNGSYVVSTTGPVSFTYNQSGANSASSGGSASIVTGGYALYPMAEVLGVYNAATKAVDGQMTLAANTVAWAPGDTVEQPHYFQQRIQADTELIVQTAPRPSLAQSAGIEYDGNNGPGLIGWQVTNGVDASSYLGNGGTHTAPDLAFLAQGVWQRSMGLEAGERAAFAVHCNSHGCGKWNSTYNLFELDSNSGVDTIQYAPRTNDLTLSLGGMAYQFTPGSFTAGVVNATTLNAGTINGVIAPASLPLFGPSGPAHTPGAVPDPGAVAGTTRYLREDGTWNAPPGGGGSSVIPGSGLVYEVAGTSARAATAYDVNRLTQGQSSVWSRYVAFGDSITACCYPSTPANLYANRLAADAGVSATVDAHSGDQACDVANTQVFPNESPADAKNALYTLMIGTNDANVKGTGAYEAVFNLCHQASISWLGSSSANKYTGASFTAVPSGWTTDTTYAAVTGLKSTSSGAVSNWPVTSYGGPVAIWYRIVDGNGGSFSYSVDGGTPVAVNAFTSPAIATQNGSTQAVGVAFATVAAGAHTVSIAVTSASGAGNLVGVLAVGTSPASTQFQGPKVWVGGTPFQENDNLSATTGEYNADVLANVTLLAGYGFGAQFVDVRKYLFGTPVEMYDTLHPNDLGHQHLEEAFESAVQPVVINTAAVVASATAAASAVAATSSFNTAIPGSPYTATLTDSTIFTNAGTVNLPAGAPGGKTYFITNYGGSPAAVVSPGGGNASGSIPANSGVVITSSGSNNWWTMARSAIPASSTPDYADFPMAIVGSPYTTTATDASVFTAGGTVTLNPSDPGGKAYFVFNYGGSNATLATSGGGSANGYVLTPGAGVMAVSSGSGKYWVVGNPPTGFTGSCAPTTTLTVVNGAITGCS
jgi:hypothetical protein